jgi:enamine deaminase RidA (YjgF/YER057c/UK114 family)
MNTDKNIQRIQPGDRMSRAVVHNGTIYVSGIVADDPSQDVSLQTADVLGKIERILMQIGSNKIKLISAQIWLADIGDFAAMNTVWDAWVIPGHTPARATVEARLAKPEYRVEIMVVAAL